MRLRPEPQLPPYHSEGCLLFVPLYETCSVARPTRFSLLPPQRYQRRTTYKFDRAPPSPRIFVNLENGKVGVCYIGSCFAGLVSCVIYPSVFVIAWSHHLQRTQPTFLYAAQFSSAADGGRYIAAGGSGANEAKVNAKTPISPTCVAWQGTIFLCFPLDSS